MVLPRVHPLILLVAVGQAQRPLRGTSNPHLEFGFPIESMDNLSIPVLQSLITHLSYFCRCYPNLHRFAHPDSLLMTAKKFLRVENWLACGVIVRLAAYSTRFTTR